MIWNNVNELMILHFVNF